MFEQQHAGHEEITVDGGTGTPGDRARSLDGLAAAANRQIGLRAGILAGLTIGAFGVASFATSITTVSAPGVGA